MQFITNSDDRTHLSVIEGLLPKADEIYIATAFLKESGLQLLLPHFRKHVKAGKTFSLIAGQNFALTEYIALQSLYGLCNGMPNANAYLANAEIARSVFHPKLLLIKSGAHCWLMSGSANLTAGGLRDNAECSILLTLESNNAVWIDARKHFDQLANMAVPLSLLSIERYKAFFQKQIPINKSARAIPDNASEVASFNYDNLLARLKEFEGQADYHANRFKDYEEAKQILDRIAESPKLTKDKFASLLDTLVTTSDGKERLWHSGSLYRLRKSVYPYSKEFQYLVKYVRDNTQKSPSEVFEEGKKLVAEIKGAGVNYLTEIMMTYNPYRFANLNANPIKVLKEEAGVYIKANSISFTQADYEAYCNLLLELGQQLGLNNMLEVDSFFNNVYWKIK